MRDISSGRLSPQEFGWKAHYLSLMKGAGLPVPPGVAVGHDEHLPGPELMKALTEALGSTADSRLAVAVRSSGVAEDSRTASHAGSLRTHLGRFTPTELTQRVADVRASAAGIMPVGVVVQKLVDLSFAGVASSMDPLTFDRRQQVVEWTTGNGQPLVGGALTAESLALDAETGDATRGHWPHHVRNLRFLGESLRRLQAILECPVDVEWGIDRSSEAIVLLQVRPIVLPRRATIALDTAASFQALPAIVRDHPKIRLRRDALAHGLRTSPAVVNVFVDNAVRADAEPEMNERLTDSVGRSVMLLHPPEVNNSVLREFAAINNFDVEFFTEGCRRYSIRRYPSFGEGSSACVDVAMRGLAHSWLAVVIDQGIYHPVATGIIRHIVDGYVVELALGHFVPKGYITTSTFLVDESFRTCRGDRQPQERAYHFVNGHVIKEEPPEEPLDLTDNEIIDATRQLATLASAQPGTALEFGILREHGEVVAYLIDAAEADDEHLALTSNAVSSGIISPGATAGRVCPVHTGLPAENLNAHLLNRPSSDEPASGIVYLAEQASVDLLPLVYGAGPDCGFAFARASVLAHLAVVLRERGIVAVRVGDEIFAELQTAGSIQIDATPGRHVTLRALGTGRTWELS
ncbi:PEP/pyruvate-binding domain-containing protein [Micromonospora sp. CPCC 205539]|uniref:PEP/pyruvate-binding domain-containing protein n=1 Tax=Micromonospora sp. CPCC 205539 TaxID=3122408 RepID=UPI002FF1196F